MSSSFERRATWRAAALLALIPLTTACTACTRGERKLDSGAQDVASPSALRDTSAVRTVPKGCFAALVAARRGGTDADRYVVPTLPERDAMQEAVSRLVARGAAERAAASSQAQLAGFEIVDVPEVPNVVLVREVESRRRGGGAYVVRLGSKSRVVVEAPHTFFDEGTLPLACELFERAEAAALFIDTAHRYKAAEPNERGEHPADVAHASDSLFQAATEGLLRARSAATIVQLHGFAPRESGASVVLSNGAPQPGDALVARAATLLVPALGPGVKRFPDETADLGATKNVQGILARRVGAKFLHIEIEASVRKALLADAQLRARFLDALTQAVDER
jgi:hypothetical protein